MSTPTSQLLRNRQNPDARLKAAVALSESEDLAAVPLLIRAAADDPEPGVRTAAREALLNLIGGETDLAIQTYRSAPDDDPWLIDVTDQDGVQAMADTTFEDDQYLVGVVTALRNHPDPRMRLRAVNALEGSNDMRVIAALAETVLWTDDPAVKKAARESLEQRFGEETDGIIQTYQVLDYVDHEEEDETDAEDGEEGWEEDAGDVSEEASIQERNPSGNPAQTSPRWQAPVASQTTSHQVVKYEGFPWLLVLIAGVALISLVVIVWLLVR